MVSRLVRRLVTSRAFVLNSEALFSVCRWSFTLGAVNLWLTSWLAWWFAYFSLIFFKKTNTLPLAVIFSKQLFYCYNGCNRRSWTIGDFMTFTSSISNAFSPKELFMCALFKKMSFRSTFVWLRHCLATSVSQHDVSDVSGCCCCCSWQWWRHVTAARLTRSDNELPRCL